MPYILKKGVETFEVVDGPFAGRKYKPGVQYQEVPPQEKKKFEELKAESRSAPSSRPRGSKLKAETEKKGTATDKGQQTTNSKKE